MNLAGRVLKTVAVAISVGISVAIAVLWAWSYFDSKGLMYTRWTVAADGTQTAKITRAGVDSGMVRIWQNTLVVPELERQTVERIFVEEYPTGWSTIFFSKGRSTWRENAENLHRFVDEVEIGIASSTTYSVRRLGFPAWLLLVVVSMPAVVALWKMLRRRQTRRRVGFAVEMKARD